MYSTTRGSLACSSCGWSGEVEVQFTYGNLYAHDYRVGDAIVWGSTQVGDPSEKRVAAEGITSCPGCRAEALFDVIIVDGTLEAVEPSTGRFDYARGEGNYVVF